MFNQIFKCPGAIERHTAAPFLEQRESYLNHYAAQGASPRSLRRVSPYLLAIIERFKNQDPVPVYHRFRDCDRLAPEGLQYVSSWVDQGLDRCFQLMETDNRELLEEWIGNWSDIVEFEIYPVISSGEAIERVAPHL